MRPDLDHVSLTAEHLAEHAPWDIDYFPGPDTNCPLCGVKMLAGIPAANSARPRSWDLWICTMCADGYHLAFGP